MSKRKEQQNVTPGEQFFLYTKLNENDTKNLKKASTNVEERKLLAQIFHLKVEPVQPNGQPNKLDLLLLDFHYINFQFCKESKYSNEKTSAFLAIMDYLLHHMLDRQLIPQAGFKILQKILDKHSIQRPPFQIYIFDPVKEIPAIYQFTAKTFFRHFSLYEFAFKPRMELVLKCEPFLNNQLNAPLCQLGEMKEMEAEEAEKLKAYLGIYNQQLGEANLVEEGLLDQQKALSMKASLEEFERMQQEPEPVNEEPAAEQEEDDEEEEQQVDWKKVGRVYKGDEQIEAVIDREMERLRVALEKKMVVQDAELEEKALAAKGKKK